MNHLSKKRISSIERVIGKKNIFLLREILEGLSPFEIAYLMMSESENDSILIFTTLSPSVALETFDYLPVSIQKSLLPHLPSEQIAELLNSLSPDDRTSFFQELPTNLAHDLIKLLPQEERKHALTLLGYPEGSVGRLMTPDYIAVKLNWTIEQVLDHIRDYGHHSETIDYIYVVDDQGKLLDDVNLKDFLFIPRENKVSSLVDMKFLALSVDDDDEVAVKTFRYHHRSALPVVNKTGALLGIVTIDDILRLSHQEEKEDTEDMQKIGGMEALDEPYLYAPFFQLMRKRAGWLVILFLGEMLTATALGYFENEISKAVVLALFLW